MSDVLLSRLAKIALIANLVGQTAIIVTGGAVRLTGSGLGCSTWPECEPGQFLPAVHEEMSIHTVVEYGNRMLGVLLGLISIAVMVLMWMAVDRFRRPRHLRVLGAAVFAGVVLQGLIGGVSVWLDLHPAVVGSHFLISGTLLVISTTLLVRWFESDGRGHAVGSNALRIVGWSLAAVAAVVVVLGVITTGAGPHSGDAEVGYRFAVDPALMSRFHAWSVWVFVAVLIALIVLARRTPAGPGVADLRRWTMILLGITLAQGVIGYVQYFNGLPELLVGAHMLGAGLLIIATTRTVLALRVRGAGYDDRSGPIGARAAVA